MAEEVLCINCNHPCHCENENLECTHEDCDQPEGGTKCVTCYHPNNG